MRFFYVRHPMQSAHTYKKFHPISIERAADERFTLLAGAHESAKTVATVTATVTAAGYNAAQTPQTGAPEAEARGLAQSPSRLA